MKQITANEVERGMVLSIHGGTEKFHVTEVAVKWGAVQVGDGFEWRGLGEDEVIEILGYFNP
jgi:hypothetical protein